MLTIKNEQEYDLALERLNVLFDAKKGTSESDEADELARLINEYEDSSHSITTIKNRPTKNQEVFNFNNQSE